MLEHFISYIQKYPLFIKKDKLLLAVSGGVDSVVLCHLCKTAGFQFGIAHCNFQLREADSLRDENFVKELASELNVPFHTNRFNTKAHAALHKQSTQEAARELRYNWFEQVRLANNYDYILTAHHADDNIETVLMNFFRGTGITGLAGIKPINGKIRRPLIFASRKLLESYLTEKQLSFVQDESNLHDDYTRNFFRNTLLPQIAKPYPEVQQNLTGNIERFKEVEILYKMAIGILQKKIVLQKDGEYFIPVLLLKKTPAMQSLLFEIVKPFGFKAGQLKEIISLMDSESGKYMLSPTHRILKDRKHLIISAIEKTIASAIVIEGEGVYDFVNGKLILKKGNIINISRNDNIASINASAIQYPLILRPWRNGDYFYPLGMPKKKKLSRFLIDKKLSLSDKEKVWVLEMNKKIIWVIGHRIDDRFKVKENTTSVLNIEFISSL